MGQLVSLPGDGTWSWQIYPTVYLSCDGNPNLSFGFDLELRVSSKSIRSGFAFDKPGFNNPQFWNQHITQTVFEDPEAPLTSLADDCDNEVSGFVDPVTQSDEDPDNFRFFHPEGAERPDPFAFTTESSVACPSSATVNGVWARGSTQALNTFASFYHIQGLPLVPGDQDLRDDPGASNTGYVDKGSGLNGTHSALIAYNNVVGNSYQLSAKNGTDGPEQLGAVLFVAPGQCTPIPSPDLAGFVLDQHMLELSVSQAQCANDQTGFTINHTPPVAGTSTINATIFDSDTGAAVLVMSQGQMFVLNPAATPRVLHFNRTLSPGPYMALALENSSVESDHFHAQAFNVPIGTCRDAVQDGSRDFLSSQHFDQDLLHPGGGGGAGLLSLSQFPGMPIDDSSALVLFLAFLLFSFFQRWLFVAIASLIGILDLLWRGAGGAEPLFGFPFTLLLVVLGVVLQILVDLRDAYLERRAEREQG